MAVSWAPVPVRSHSSKSPSCPVLLFDAVVVRLASISRRSLGWVLIALVCVGVCARARADDLTDFEKARALYEKRNYAGAVAAFVAMVGSDPPRVSERLLLLESRKYLAASLLFQGRPDEASAQFRLLLTQEPDYTIDPLAFRLHYHLGLLYGKQENVFEAIEALEIATELRPRDFSTLKNLAVLYQRAGFRLKATELWERALSSAPDEATRANIKSHLVSLL